ncbi:glycosyltransferase [Arthrobacter sp. StoSoilA2]|uniref:glycosyltransferase n=1 Tax=Arthrobacter sp. StoSoilA2 TaxID=2830990 RepID=UPI001CC7EFBE|nr:glycosyltransferase [Arthrobacter sp. StoSoilA2]
MDLVRSHGIHTGSRQSLPTQGRAASLRRSHVDLEVIIPAYNEAARIPRTLIQTTDFLSAQPWSSRIVVVDNASVDETGAVIRRLFPDGGTAVPISVIGCSRRGKGAAVRRGLLSGTSRFTGFFDADMATPLETLTSAMSYLQEGAAAVIASRHAPGSTLVRPQQLGRRMGGKAFRAHPNKSQGHFRYPVRFQVLRTGRAHCCHGPVPGLRICLRRRTASSTSTPKRQDHRVARGMDGRG